jgi:hypothetical protein
LTIDTARVQSLRYRAVTTLRAIAVVVILTDACPVTNRLF